MPWAYFSTLEAKRVTAERKFRDKRSKVGIRLDGREFEKLFGIDKELRREEIRERAKNHCEDCGVLLLPWQGEWHHIRSRGCGGDDSLANGLWLCGPESPNRCHRKKHPRPRWTAQEQMAGSSQ